MTMLIDLQKYIPPESREPWSSWWWDGELTIAFGHATCGWIQLALMTTTWSQGVIIQCSEPWSPFGNMANWLADIADRRFPAIWKIDEEGRHRTLIAAAEENDKVDFQVWEEDPDTHPSPPPKLGFRTRLDRMQLLREFHRKFSQYVKEDFDIGEWTPPSPWNTPEDLATIDLSRVADEIKKFPKAGPARKNRKGVRRKDFPA
ncbi:MAG: hypothetical protein FDZ69_06560 [Deltaproteobacteria bacterium]|nr:MAG: hypothetical protein FDZ69_06560 [Deltaproteobacteria bacterium]